MEKASLYSGLLSDSIQSLIEDREGNIWVGTTAGLQRLTERKVTPVVNVGLVTSIEATGDNGIWVGTSDAVIRLSPGATEWKQDRLANPAAPYVRALHRDGHGTLWIGANQGLFKMTGRRVERISLAAVDVTTPIVRITSDAHDRVWLSDGSQLIAGTVKELLWFRDRLTFQSSPFRCIFHDSKAQLWVAFVGGAMATVEDGGWRVFGASEGWTGTHRSVYDIFEDEHGVLWILVQRRPQPIFERGIRHARPPGRAPLERHRGDCRRPGRRSVAECGCRPRETDATGVRQRARESVPEAPI